MTLVAPRNRAYVVRDCRVTILREHPDVKRLARIFVEMAIDIEQKKRNRSQAE
jgi:hypothetical protein